jgi:hypothetical protein
LLCRNLVIILLLLCWTLTISTDNPVSSVSPQDTASSTSTLHHFPNSASWRGYMSKNPPRKIGCFVVTFPSAVWNATTCVSAPHIPLLPARPLTVGAGHDWITESPTTIIGSSVGTFQSVAGITTETDTCPTPSTCGQGQGPNRYSLQVNSNLFSTDTTYTDGRAAEGWEQFVYVNYKYCEGTACSGCNSILSASGCVYIQYWLFGYYAQYGTCPSTGPPGLTSQPWSSPDKVSCYANGPAVGTPSDSATNLANSELGGFANYESATYGANDYAVYCDPTNCYGAAVTDQVLNLYQNWHYSEFGVFGYGGGSEAVFNAGTSITVVNNLSDKNGNSVVPSPVCTQSEPTYTYGGIIYLPLTEESNNLNLISCSASSAGIVVPENNYPTLTTNVVSGSGSVSPYCPTGCSEADGSLISVSASPQLVGRFRAGVSVVLPVLAAFLLILVPLRCQPTRSLYLQHSVR